MSNYLRLLLFLSIILFFFIGCSSPPQTTLELENKITEKIEVLNGDFAVVFKNFIDTTESVCINEREMFHAASTMKTPVMIELYKQAEAGNFSLDDSIEIKNEFRSIVDSSRYQMDINEDSEGELYELIGQKRPIRDLIHDMITMSSNLATNILIEQVGAHNVTQTMRSYGADSIEVLGGYQGV